MSVLENQVDLLSGAFVRSSFTFLLLSQAKTMLFKTLFDDYAINRFHPHEEIFFQVPVTSPQATVRISMYYAARMVTARIHHEKGFAI